MKYKIQMASVSGWGDMKSSTDGRPYKVCLYKSREEAQDEIDVYVSCLDGASQDGYQIVPRNTPAEIDLY